MDREQLARLILGDLPDDERDEVEARILADPDALEEAEAVEAELSDAYARGELAPARQAAWETRVSLSPRLRRRVEFARILDTVAARSRPAPRSPSWRELWQRRPGAWAFPSALLAAGLLAAIVLGWLGLELRSAREDVAALRLEREALRAANAKQEQERASAEERIAALSRSVEEAHATAVPRLPRLPFVSLALGLGAIRDGGDGLRLSVPPQVDEVRLEVDLEGASAYRSLRAVLRTEAGVQVFAEDGLAPRAAAGLASLTVNVPAAVLVPGAYVLTLDGVMRSGGRETAAVREFEVERRAGAR